MANPYYKQHWINIEPERVAAYDQILAYRPALQPLIGTLNLGPGLKVLDVGSGPGYTTMELARRVGASGLVTGVDINADFVAAASKRAWENDLGVEFVRSEFPPLPFPDSAFDRVLCKNVLEYVDSAARTVAEMARVAVKGGVVVAIDSDWDMLALDLPEPARERRTSNRRGEVSRSQGTENRTASLRDFSDVWPKRRKSRRVRRRRHERPRPLDAQD